LKLDDPSFPAPIFANLMADDCAQDAHNLIWSRGIERCLNDQYPCSYSMSRLQHLSSTLSNDDARAHRLSGCHAGHDRPVCYPKIVYSIHFESTVHDRH
jgi:hypothetical protein